MEDMMCGQEYITSVMTMETYLRINDEIREEIAITVSVKTDLYSTDETYKDLVKQSKKAKTKARNYEFDKRNQ